MKKAGTILGMILVTLYLHAQQPEGETKHTETQKTETQLKGMWIGGSMGASDGYLFLGPSWGMMYNDDWAIGATLQLGIGNNQVLWNLSPYARYYFPITDNFHLFGQGSISIQGENTNDVKTTTFGIAARPGLEYWFTPRWSVTSTLGGLAYEVSKVENMDAEGDFSLAINFSQINFSLFWHF